MMQPWLSLHIPVGEVPTRLGALSILAADIDSAKHMRTEQVRYILERVTVSKTSIQIQVSEAGLLQTLAIAPDEAEQASQTKEPVGQELVPGIITLPGMDNKENPLLISMNSHLLRSGKQVKLILGNDMSDDSEPNPRLVVMVAKTRQWFDGLKSGRYPTIKHIAIAENCDTSYVGRLMSIAFLAPDIVERILTGNHSATLTPERLRKACPLPLRWEDQRALLLH